MLARDDEHMDCGVRVNVGEGDALLVLVDAGGGDAFVDDLAEEAGHNWFSIGLVFEVAVLCSLREMVRVFCRHGTKASALTSNIEHGCICLRSRFWMGEYKAELADFFLIDISRQ